MTLLSPSLGHSPRPCHILQWKMCDLLLHQQQHPALLMTPPAHPRACTTPCMRDAMRSMTADGSATDGARRKHLGCLTGIWRGAALPDGCRHISSGKRCPLRAPAWSHCPQPLEPSSYPRDNTRTRDARDLKWLIPIPCGEPILP